MGYCCSPVVDANEKPVCGSGGVQLNEWVIDEKERCHVEDAFRLFTVEHCNMQDIAAHLNDLEVRGKKTWTSCTIRSLLSRRLYEGVHVWNQRRTSLDSDTGKVTVTRNPENEWILTENRKQWQIIPDKLWEQTQARLKEVADRSPRTGKKASSKNHVYPSTLFSGVLYCGVCGHELLLRRSDGKHQQFACTNSCERKMGCTFKGSKSVRIIDECLLAYIKDRVLTEDAVDELVVKANAYLAEEAQRPRPDTQPLEEALKTAKAESKWLVEKVLTLKDEHNIRPYLAKGDELEKHIADLQNQVREAQAANAAPPPPLNRDRIIQMLGHIREVLNQGVAVSGPLLRKLLGQVTVNQVPVEGKKKPLWVASVKADLVPLLARVAKDEGYPDSHCLDVLTKRIWIVSEAEEVALEIVPAYISWAPMVKALKDEGLTLKQIAERLDITTNLAMAANLFASKGIRWWTKTGDKVPGRHFGVLPQYVTLSGAVAELRDLEGASYRTIADKLRISVETANRAYSFHHRQRIQQELEQGTAPADLWYSGIDPGQYRLIRQLLAEGRPPREVAKEAGCTYAAAIRIHQMVLAKNASRVDN